MYVDQVDLCVHTLLECTKSRPSRNREGVGGGCLDQILARMKGLVYKYVWGLIGSYVEILLEWTGVRPSRNREGLGGGCLDQILARIMCHVYVYVCP